MHTADDHPQLRGRNGACLSSQTEGARAGLGGRRCIWGSSCSPGQVGKPGVWALKRASLPAWLRLCARHSCRPACACHSPGTKLNPIFRLGASWCCLQDYPEHRLQFFSLLRAITNHCSATLFAMSPVRARSSLRLLCPLHLEACEVVWHLLGRIWQNQFGCAWCNPWQSHAQQRRRPCCMSPSWFAAAFHRCTACPPSVCRRSSSW